MLTRAQITERRGYIGGSDAPAVCDVDVFRTSYDVWLSKTGKVDDFQGNAATDAGTRLERSVLQWAADKLQAVEANAVHRRHPHVDYIAANLDCLVLLPIGVYVDVEAKTSGICSPLRYDNWTDDDFPETYRVQIAHQLACDPKIDHAYLAALIPPKGFVLYHVARNQGLIDAIMEREIDFWEKHVLRDIPPDSAPSLEVAKRIRRVPNKTVTIDLELARSLLQAKADLSAAKQREEQAQAALLAAMGDAEMAYYPGGGITYYEQSRAGYTVQPTKFRTLRFTKKG